MLVVGMDDPCWARLGFKNHTQNTPGLKDVLHVSDFTNGLIYYNGLQFASAHALDILICCRKAHNYYINSTFMSS